MNILVLLSDQHHRRYLGCAGHPVIETPHLDRLARQGVRFESAYCPSPLCGPSRMSFLTGLYPCHTGIYANGQALPSDLPTFAHALGAAGYQTALVGRMHLVGDDQKHGFEEKILGDVTSSTLGGGIQPLLEGLHAGSGPDGLLLSGPGDSAYHHYDDAVTDQACAWLSRQDGRRPFCLTVGFALPHNPFVCSPEDYVRYEGRVTLPVRLDETKDADPSLSPPTQVPVSDQVRALTAYCGSVTATDRRIGRILAQLEQQGLASDTLIVYTSDHGEAAGERGLWFKCTMYEGSAGIPLVLCLPGVLPAGQVYPECVNLVDVTATLLDLAGIPALPGCDGRSLRPLWAGPAGAWVNQTFSEYGTRWGSQELTRMVRRDGWKYVYHDGYSDELFDLSADPDERRNLAGASELQTIRQELSSLLMVGWDPVKINREMDLWKQRNAVIYGWYMSRERPDPELYEGPPGCNRLDRVPTFVPHPVVRRGMY